MQPPVGNRKWQPMEGARLQVTPIEEAPSLKTRTYDALKAAINAMNIYADGAELRLDERALSLQFGVSRTPLREAVAQLEQEGLVSVVPRRGIFIVRKTKAEILEMITVWAALESMAARLVTDVASDEDIASLHPLVDAFASSAVAAQMGEYSDANIKFHGRIIALSQCKHLVDITNGLFMHVRAIRHRAIFEKDRARRSIADHKEIVEALETRHAERAERLVREHTLRLRDHVAQHVNID